MAVVKNTFSTTLDSVTSNTRHVFTGLMSTTSTYTSSNYISPEVSKYFLQSLYQTLIDAGYTDTVINEEEYSITVLGFKFFVICEKYSNSPTYDCIPNLYVYGTNGKFSFDTSSSSRIYGINRIDKNEKELEYSIVVRGDENCVSIMYSSGFYPNNENPLIFIAKAKNLITSEDAFFYSSQMNIGSTSIYSMFYFRNKNDLYNNVSDNNNYFDFLSGSYYNNGREKGLNTSTKYVCIPVLGYYGSYLVKSMLMSNARLFVGKKYYKIGVDIYYCYGYSNGNNPVSNSGGYPVLFKVS